MASLFDSSQNMSLFTIPLAWMLSIAPHWYASLLYRKASARKIDSRQPRALINIVAENQSIDSATKARFMRAQGAQQNGFENIGLFAAAVVAGNMAHLHHTWLNALSVGYVLSRIVYNLVYINNTTAALATTRTVVFVTGQSMLMTLFVLAGYKMRNLT